MTLQQIQARLASQIRLALGRSDIATSEISRMSGLASDTIYRMRRGESLTLSNLHTLAEALDMELCVELKKRDQLQ